MSIPSSFLKNSNERAKHLLKINSIFLNSIKKYINAEIIVGSLAWGMHTAVGEKSDIDIVIVYEKKYLLDLINSPYLISNFSNCNVDDLLTQDKVDYIFAKFQIDDIDFSVDIIDTSYFEKMCNLNLIDIYQNVNSRKFGITPQTNYYQTNGFYGNNMIVKKTCTSLKNGYVIDLPLFNLFKSNNTLEYYYGIPTIKLLTSIVYYENEYDVEFFLDKLKDNIVQRMNFEYRNDHEFQSNTNKKYNLINLFVFYERMDENVYKLFNISAKKDWKMIGGNFENYICFNKWYTY